MHLHTPLDCLLPLLTLLQSTQLSSTPPPEEATSAWRPPALWSSSPDPSSGGRVEGTYMMDAAEEIPHHSLDHGKKPCVDGETQQQADAVSKVLGDDNLLWEIIVRVGFPTTLVRAALVCKRWLGHASDPAFLRRFRELHPPCLLGYYISEWSVSLEELGAPRFVPMLPQPPELATVICRVAGYRFGTHDDGLRIMHCGKGSIFTKRGKGRGLAQVHLPLCPEKGMPIVPPLPCIHERNLQKFSAILSRQEGGLSYLYVLGEFTRQTGKSTARVYMLQDGVWRMHTSATCQLHALPLGSQSVLIDNKIYMPSDFKIIVLDLTASSFSTIQFPQGVEYNYSRTMLSPVDDASGVYLIHAKEFQLRIWLHKGDNWLLVDTICLHEMFANLRILDHLLENEDIADVRISQVGDNAQFVFLKMGRCIFYLDIKCRTLCKVYENEIIVNDRRFGAIHPFMMIWPPIFPPVKDYPARNAM